MTSVFVTSFPKMIILSIKILKESLLKELSALAKEKQINKKDNIRISLGVK